MFDNRVSCGSFAAAGPARPRGPAQPDTGAARDLPDPPIDLRLIGRRIEHWSEEPELARLINDALSADHPR